MFILKVIGIILLTLFIGIVFILGFAALCKHIDWLPDFVGFIERILDNIGINFFTKIS